MAEEMTDPVREAPEQAPPTPEPVHESPRRPVGAPAPVQPAPARKGSPLLTFLTVLLVLVGVADAILWGVVGYHALRNYLDGNGGQPAQAVSAEGTANGGETGGAEEQEALLAYLQEIDEAWDLATEVTGRWNRIQNESGMDDAAIYTEISENLLPLCRQLKEKVDAVAPSDPEISEVHAIYRQNAAEYLDAMTMLLSALNNQDEAQLEEASDLFTQTIASATSYNQGIQRLADARNVPLDMNA